MDARQVIRFEYQQCLTYASDRSGWSDSLDISVRVMAEAITSGWYRNQFGKHASDFVILLAIVMHARPLSGSDLSHLISLGIAREQDAGRLYARVTDSGLADELGFHRQTIASSTNRMAQRGFLEILDLPEMAGGFRDQHGRYGGTKVYLLAGDLQHRFIQKDVCHRDGKIDTASLDRVEKTASAGLLSGQEAPHRVEEIVLVEGGNGQAGGGFFDIPDEDFVINREESEEDEEEAGTLQEKIFNHFASAKGLAQYLPSFKEQEALEGLLRDGYTVPEILAGIDVAFQRTRPRYFTLCARIIRERPPASQPESCSPFARTQPEGRQAKARPESCNPGELVIETKLAKPVAILVEAGEEVGVAQLARLRLMLERCEQAALQVGSEASTWVAEALARGVGVSRPGSLLAYADAVLDDWIANGDPPRRKRTRKSSPWEGRSKGRQAIEDYLRKREGECSKNGF